MFTHLPPGQQQAGTRLNTHESGAAFDRKKTRFLKEPLTHPGPFFISHSTRERLCVQGTAELLLNYERARARSGSGEEAICKV